MSWPRGGRLVLVWLGLALLGCAAPDRAAIAGTPASPDAVVPMVDPSGRDDRVRPDYSAPPGYGEVHVIVLGVTSPFSTFGLGRRFLEVPGVAKMRFIMEEGRAVLWLKPGARVSEDELRKAVRNASFTTDRIIWVRPPAPEGTTPPQTSTRLD